MVIARSVAGRSHRGEPFVGGEGAELAIGQESAVGRAGGPPSGFLRLSKPKLLSADYKPALSSKSPS